MWLQVWLWNMSNFVTIAWWSHSLHYQTVALSFVHVRLVTFHIAWLHSCTLYEPYLRGQQTCCCPYARNLEFPIFYNHNVSTTSCRFACSLWKCFYKNGAANNKLCFKFHTKLEFISADERKTKPSTDIKLNAVNSQMSHVSSKARIGKKSVALFCPRFLLSAVAS